MLIQNNSNYKVIVLSESKPEFLKPGDNLAKTVLPFNIYIKLGISLSHVTTVTKKLDKIIINDSLVNNEVDVEFVE